MNDHTGYPWSTGDVLLAGDLNSAIANAGGGGGMRVTDWLPPGQPDGVTDNSGDIQAAIDAAAGVVGGDRAAAPGLSTIVIPATDQPYMIGASVMVPSNSHIVVAHGATIQQLVPCTFFRCTPLAPSIGPISNVLIELYGTLDGQWVIDPSIPTTPPGTYIPPLGVGIGGGPCNNVYVRGNRQGLIKNIKNSGLNLTSATNCEVSGVTFDTLGDSVEYAGITTVVAHGVSGTYNSTTGAASLTTDVVHGVVVGGVFTLVPPAGVTTTATAAVPAGGTVVPVTSTTGIVVGMHAYLTGTTIGSSLGLPDGTFVVSIAGLNVTLSAATINDGILNGDAVRFAAAGPLVTIAGTFTATAGTGGTTLNFTANKAIGSYSFTGNRVGTLQRCSNVSLVDCVIRNVHDFGVCLYGGVVNGAIRDCEVTRCKAGGVTVVGDSGQPGLSENCEIHNCFIHDNFSAGIIIAGLQSGSHPHAISVTDNIIYRNNKTGIALATCDGIDISDNHLESNTYGWLLPPIAASGEIAVQSSAIRCSIRNNTIVNAQTGGTVQTATIVSGTYNATTGEVRLVTNVPLVVNSVTGQKIDFGNMFVVSGAAGTGSSTTLAALNGLQSATDSIAVDGNGNSVEQTSGTVIYFVDTSGMAAAAITGGTVSSLRGYGISLSSPAYVQASGNRIGDYQPTLSMQGCIGGIWGVHGLSQGNFYGPRIDTSPDQSTYGSSTQGLSYDTQNSSWLGSGTFAGSVNFAVSPTAPTLAPGTNTTQAATTAFVQAAVASGGVVDGTFSDGGGGYPAETVTPLRLQGMAFVGSGWDSTYTTYAPPPAGTGSWITQTWPNLRYLEKGTQLRVGSEVGGAAALHFTRASDNGQLSTDPAVIGTISFSYNDVLGTRGSWGHYLEAHRVVGAGPAIGTEIEVCTHGDDVVPVGPYGYPGGASPRTLAFGLGIGCGGGGTSPPTYNGGNPIYITPNPNRFKLGITFLYTALVRDIPGDETSPAHALLLGKGHQIEWHRDVSGNPSSYIRSDNDGLTKTALIFEQTGCYIVSAPDEQLIAGFFPTVGSVNYLRFSSALTGGTPTIQSGGADTNISVTLVGKGTGGVRLVDGASNPRLVVNTTGVGFNGTAPIAKPTVSGSRGGNAALASLVTALAAYGLVIDSTSA